MTEKIYYPLQSKNWLINTFSYPWDIELNGSIQDEVLVVKSTVTEYNNWNNILKSGGDISGITLQDIQKYHTISLANKYVYTQYETITNKKEFDYPEVWDNINSTFITQNFHNFLNHEGTAGHLTIIQIPWQMRGHRIKPTSINILGCFLNNDDVGYNSLVVDDGLGNLRVDNNSRVVGHVDYDQGFIIVWDMEWDYQIGSEDCHFTWSSDLEIKTLECLVDIKPNILWSSFNLTWVNNLISSSDSNNNFPSGWDPFPHFTAIGLYNDDNELLMVAKLAQPIKRTNAIDQLVHIRHDF